MGESEGWAEPEVLLPNGLLPGAGHVLRALDSERWARAEERTAELIACIQPNELSEERRNAVAEYVRQLIMKCFPCQVCTFGSVPLKTYLPDGDIDLTAFSQDQNLKDNWANQVRDMLQNEENNENAEFHVKEVQYIQAEVKIIKCLVENIVVDISFNQVGGLCTLCFLVEVDHLIKQNHLFKRSIILIKAWCYYESRILGAHHGLISTYALETLVLYIFHLFNNSFHGPLEVLYRFLEFFSVFDWDNFCVSLWGPVPISSLPDVTAESPRKDTDELLLTKVFLEACSSVYAVFPGGQDNNGQQFVSKHFNVIDPLRVNNNLGRSVSKGNFFRIRSAFAFGAKRLARLLNCPEENLSFEVNQFFMNTWERHGSGHRPDAPGVDAVRIRLSNPDGLHEFGNSSNNLTGNNVNQNQNPSIHSVSSQHGKNSASHPKNLKSQKSKSSRVSDRGRREHPSDWVVNDEVQKANHHVTNDIHGRFFARTSSSPELTDPYGSDFSSHSRHNRKSETLNTPIPSKQSLDMGKDSHLDASGEEFPSASGAMHQEEQDIVNMMASASLQGLNGQFHVPYNLNPAQLPFSIPPSFLASMGYTQRKFVPTNFPLMDPSFSNLQFSSNLVSPHLTHYFPSVGANSTSKASFEQGNDNLGSEELDNDYWQEHEIENDKPSASISGLKYIPPHRLSSSDSAKGVQLKNTREKHGLSKKNSDGFSTQDDGKSEIYAEERSVSSRFSTRSNSVRSRASSESSWDGSSAKMPKSTKEKRGKKKISSADYGKGKIMSEHVPDQPEIEDSTAIFERNSKPESVSSLQIHAHSLSDLETAQPSGSDSIMSFAPMLIGPGSRQRMNDNSGLVAFYPTGPPIPFLTMLPVYNVPPEAGASDDLENSDSVQNFSPEGYGHSEDFNPSNSLRSTSTTKNSDNKKPDILTSDFASHWHNLQFGRLCQNPRNGPSLYPSPVMVPPRYLQGVRFPYDNPGRSFSTNADSSPQIMTGYGQHMVPVAPTQTVSSKPNIYQSYMDDVPRYPGTGTYHPNHSIRERLPSGTRRGSFNTYDKNDSYGDKDGHWNMNQKSRPVRGHSRNNQTDKSNPRPWNNSYRNESIPSYQSQNHNGPQNMAYNMYPLAATNPNAVSNGLSGQPLLMIYPYDHTMYGEQLEFGSLGPVVDTPGVDEQLQLNDGTQGRVFQDHRLYGGSEQHSSPDQPSSPHYQRRV